MKLRRLASIVVLVAAGVVAVPAATPVMPLDEIRPGMTGTGVTVFSGTSRTEFTVEIIGVLRNVVGPRRNLVLARLDGGPLAQTGVVQGMSGSPVYIDGRLVGAVSYSLGTFAKEPIAGITPIEEMTEATAQPARRAPPGPQARLELPVTPDGLARALRGALARFRPFAYRPADVQALGLPVAAASQMGVLLRPIATPIVLAGFEPEVRDLLASAFAEQGFAPVAGGDAGSVPDEATEPLQPGDPVAVSLITGDLSLAGTGTVTAIDGTRVYAFGHPFYNVGPAAFPMHRAYVHALLPSLFTSVKIASVGAIVGTFEQDRATGIAGTLGPGPALVPIAVELESPDRNGRRAFQFRVAQDQLFTPLLTYVSVLNTLRSYEREFGAATFTVRGRTSVRGHGDVTFENVFTGEQPSMGAAAYIAAPITALLGNDFKPVQIDRVDVAITAIEQPLIATLERIWVDEVRPRAGQTVPLRILTRSYRGEEMTRAVAIEIPANATGTLTLLVADGTGLAQWERREIRQPVQPQSVDQMIRELNRQHRNNRLYVRLLRRDAGAVVNGEKLSSLPPSVLAVLEAERNGGDFIPLRTATIGEWEFPTDHAVSGSRTLTINVEAR